LFNYI